MRIADKLKFGRYLFASWTWKVFGERAQGCTKNRTPAAPLVKSLIIASLVAIRSAGRSLTSCANMCTLVVAPLCCGVKTHGPRSQSACLGRNANATFDWYIWPKLAFEINSLLLHVCYEFSPHHMGTKRCTFLHIIVPWNAASDHSPMMMMCEVSWAGACTAGPVMCSKYMICARKPQSVSK